VTLGEYSTALQIPPDRFGFIEVPYKNFDYCLKQTTVQPIQGGSAQEVIVQRGLGISVRGGRLVRLDTMENWGRVLRGQVRQ
jgi:hypothetical protein